MLYIYISLKNIKVSFSLSDKGRLEALLNNNIESFMCLEKYFRKIKH